MRKPNFLGSRVLGFILKSWGIASLMVVLGLPVRAATSPSVTLAAGSSDEQIQAALDHMGEGAEVILAPGTYQIHQPIILRHDHQTLRGSGDKTTLHLADKANCPVIVLGSPLIAPRHVTSHLRLADLVIDGNRKNQQVEMWRSAVDGDQLNNNGVDIWDVKEASVDHVTCYRCRSGGLVTASVRYLNLSDFTAYDNQFDGLACYQTEESHFSHLNLHDNVAAGISIDLGFNHNVIKDSVLTGNDLGIFMRDSRNNVFRNLTISKSRKHGVFMAQASGPVDKGWGLSPGTECIGNDFYSLTVTESGGTAFLVNDASCKDNAIADARFADNRLGGLREGDGKPNFVALTLAADQPVPVSKPAVRSIQAFVLPH